MPAAMLVSASTPPAEAPTATIPRGSLFALFVSGPISVRVPSDLLDNPVVVPRRLIPNAWRL